MNKRKELIKTMKEEIKELVKEHLANGDDITDLAQELYNHEINFNNADTTSGQRCFTYSEIDDEIQRLIK